MEHSTKKLGMMFTLGGWILGILLLGLIFYKILDFRDNPNQFLITGNNPENQEIVLQRNPYGHYLFNGEINRKTKSIFLDFR